MRNTKQKGQLNFRIFKWKGRYLGICKETGFVEEADNFEEVKKKLQIGTIALLRAVLKSSENLEPSLNTSPPIKYAIYFYVAPLLVMIESFKDIFNEVTNKSEGSYSFFTISSFVPL